MNKYFEIYFILCKERLDFVLKKIELNFVRERESVCV